MVTWDISFVGAAASGLTQGELDDIAVGVIAAGKTWEQYIAPIDVTLSVSIDVSDAFNSNVDYFLIAESDFQVFTGQNSFGQEIYRPGALHELITGNDPNGSQTDISIDFARFSDYFFDPDPLVRSAAIPLALYDFQTFAIHALGHALGFSITQASAADVAGAQRLSAFEDFVFTRSGNPFFSGANAIAVYGDAVPLDPDFAFSHIGVEDPLFAGETGEELSIDIMSALIPNGLRADLNPLNLAILEDLGLPLRKPTADGDILIGYEVIDAGLADTAIGTIPDFYNGNDTIDGGAGNDDIIGLSGKDELRGSDGNDTLDGGLGADTLIGNRGTDSLFGGKGIDRLLGGDGDDMLFGGDGDDSLGGEAGADQHFGEAGNDFARGRGGYDTLFGGEGNDTLIGDAGWDSLEGGAGADRLEGGIGSDTAYGGDGNDTVLGQNAPDRLHGNKGDDVMRGGNGGDLIFGGFGDDRVEGNAGNDRVNGEGGDDDVYGGSGNDTLLGRDGDDTLHGGGGDDVFIFAPGEDTDVIRDFNAGAGSDDVIDLSAFGADFDTFAEVFAVARQNGPNTLIDFGNGDRLSLWNVNPSSLDADDFLFG